jgi:hypothetical protein
MERYISPLNEAQVRELLPLCEEDDSDKWDEGIKYRYVIRKGKKLRKAKSTRPGYRIKWVNKRPIEVKMSPQFRRKLSRIMKKSARKRKGKMRMILAKRKRSMKKHTW